MQTQPMAAPLQTPQTPQAPQAPQQPQVNYQPTPPPIQMPTPNKPQKNRRISTILAIIFGITTVALLAFIVIDKLKPQEQQVDTDVSTAPLSTRLSEISTPEGSESDIFKKTLAGRTFTVNASFEEYVTFTSESKYLFSYYEKPVEGRPKLQASSKPGTYTVNNKTISLDNGETFEIVGDYLVKNTEKVSKNRTAVYFDALQLNSVIPNVSLALNNYLKSNKKPQDADFEKTRIDRFFCHADRSFKKMTNADSYICDTIYSYVFDQSKIQPQITTAKVKDFPTYCLTKGNSYSSYVSDGGNCNSDYSISNWSYVIVRTDNVTYRVTGAFRTVSDSTEALPRF